MVEHFYANGRRVGWGDGATYHSVRDYNKNEVFKKPEFGSAVGISADILRGIVSKQYKYIELMIVNFEKDSFFLVSTIAEFLKHSHKIHFGGYDEQYIMEMNNWQRNYHHIVTIKSFEA